MNKLGFTMVEMIAVVLIISVVSSVALPAIDNFRSSDRCKAEASKLVDSIRLAKYSAMEENTLHRIFFSPDGDAYKVQKYEGSENYDEAITNTEQDETNVYDLETTNWANISDEEEVSVDTAVEADFGSLINRSIYFQPNGYIYYCGSVADGIPISIIPEETVTFKKGSSAIAVAINSLGVLSSEAISVDEDEFFEDDSSVETGKERDKDDPTTPGKIGGDDRTVERDKDI